MYSFVSTMILLLCLFTNLQADSIDNFAYGLKNIRPTKSVVKKSEKSKHKKEFKEQLNKLFGSPKQDLSKKQEEEQKRKQKKEQDEQIKKLLEIQKEQDLLKKQEEEKSKQEQQDKLKKTKEFEEQKEQKSQQEKEITEEELLGPWMVKNRPKDLIAYDQNKHIYQIKVLKQWKGDCWVHSFRNVLYFLDLLDSPRKEFDTIYNKMVAREGYEAFTHYGCPKLGSVTREFIDEQLGCRPDCIPQNSPEYLKKIVTLQYEPAFDKNAIETIQNKLYTIEGEIISKQAAFDYLLLTLKFNYQVRNIRRLVELIHALRNNTTYSIGFNLTSNTIKHEITLVAHKYNNTIEYLFSDSNNVSFTGNNKKTINEKGETIYYTMSDQEYDLWKNTFSAAIHQIISFIENPESFDDTIVRILYNETIDYYLQHKQHNIEKFGLENWKHLDDFAVQHIEPFYSNLKKYNLLNSSAYTSSYKKLYCDFIKQEQKVHYNQAFHKKLLKTISC